MKIGNAVIGNDRPTYFIADIAANHDGDIERAKKLIELAKEAGADCAKFQHFKASTIVSDKGFKAMAKGSMSHQDKWKKSVFEVYQDASVPLDWTPILKAHCDKVGIEFMTTPYDISYLETLNKYVNAYKIGSGDITWHAFLEKVAAYGKPVLIATGASTLSEVEQAMTVLRKNCKDIVLMQCNTNYTGSIENMHHVNLNVLHEYKKRFPDVILGLSDHTPGCVTVLGAVALGARVVEKHFTDDVNRTGPDHGFSMTPKTWREMVDQTRLLEASLGDGIKRVEQNERDTVVVQRRCLRAATDLKAGTVLSADHLHVLRPAPHDAIFPQYTPAVIGKTLKRDIAAGEHFTWSHV
jgi:N-acetylneuraminate synthase